MTKTELEKFKKLLLEKQAELERFVRNRDGIAIEKAADAIDRTRVSEKKKPALRISQASYRGARCGATW